MWKLAQQRNEMSMPDRVQRHRSLTLNESETGVFLDQEFSATAGFQEHIAGLGPPIEAYVPKPSKPGASSYNAILNERECSHDLTRRSPILSMMSTASTRTRRAREKLLTLP